MKFIREKKLDTAIVVVILYLTICLTNWSASRGSNALSLLNVDILGGLTSDYIVVLSNPIFALFVGGVVNLLIYELVTMYIFRSARQRLGDVALDLKYVLRWFFIIGNIIAALIKLTYLVSPLVTVFGEVLIDFVVISLVCVAYYRYICKHFLPKPLYAKALYILGTQYLIISSIIAIIPILGELV